MLTTVGVYALQFTSWLVYKAQRHRHDRVVRAIGWLYAILNRPLRRVVESNLAAVVDFDPRQRALVARRSIENFCVTLYDFFQSDGVVLETDDLETLRRLHHQHKRLLILTFHVGHWELGARYLQQQGFPVTAVYQEYRNKAMRRLIQRHRASGVNFLPVGANAANRVLEAFSRGDVVAMLGDHPFGEAGARVQLNGHTVLWPKGPVTLAVRSNTPIVTAAVVRVGHRRYRAHMYEPVNSIKSFARGSATLGSGSGFEICYGRAQVSRSVVSVSFNFFRGVAQLVERLVRD
jgi:Kdo2-lipid IVA lauroyltransferase/acyltransferase